MSLSLTKLKFAFGIAFLISLQLVFSQTTPPKPKQQGLLWEITGNNLKKPSYLYGTMHVSKKLAFHLTDTFFVALKSCDMVALEINPETFMEDILNSNMATLAMNMEYGSNRDFFDNVFLTPMPSNKIIGFSLAQDNDFANYLLYRSMYQENFEENTYLDLFIFQAAKKLNKKVFGLENLNETLELSVMAQIPDKDEEKEYDREDNYIDRHGRYDKLEDAYRKGNLDLLDSISKMSSTKKYLKYMLYYRNELMVKNMDSLMQKNSLFTGVGAAHLPGDEGMINLLRKKGYKVRAVTGNINQINAKTKDKIEKTIYKSSYSTQYSEDSIFKVNLPGKIVSGSTFSPYASRSKELSREYFYPDMINGAYYRITRINTYASLEEVNEAHILKRIDSLLYENIPGKILKKKAIVQNGYPGYEINNKTKKGDIQRYKIVVTPMEIIIFQLAGTGEFVTVEGEKFFGSIEIKNQTNAWKTFEPASGGFSVSMPGLMTVEDHTNQRAGSRKDYQLQSLDESNKNYYLFLKASYYDFEYIEEDTFELNYLAKIFYKQWDYKPVSEKFTTFQGYPAMDLKIKKENKQDMYLKLVIAGPSYFLLGVKTSQPEAAEKYFNTFRIKEFKYAKEFIEYYDSSMCFKVKTLVNPYGNSKFSNQLVSLYKERYQKDEPQESQFKEIKLNSNATSEVVLVEYRKFHDYVRAREKKDFWKARIEVLTEENGLIAKEKSSDENSREMILTDTNSTRAIKVKMILKEGVLYTLSANVDTIGKESLFVSTFFKSFQPGDTLIGVSPFKNKSELFFEKLAGKDSASIAQALLSIDMIHFEDKHAPELIKIFEQYEFSKYLKKPAFIKTDIMREVGYLHHKSILPFLEKQYKQATDSVSVQLAALRALASQKLPEANLSILRLLKTEVPLADYRDIEGVFYRIQDSLKLAAPMFPELMQYTRYQEYKDNIYELLSMLVDSGYVKPDIYLSYKSEIIREANEELRRRIASEEGVDDNSYNSYNDNYNDYDYEYDYNNNYDKVGRVETAVSRYYGYARSRDKFERFAILLLPIYNEPAVKSFFGKLTKVKDKDLLLNISTLLLKNKKEVNDTVWTHLATNNNYRIKLYQSLKEINRLDKFDPKFKTEQSMLKGILYSSSYIDKDTIVFLEKRKVNRKEKDTYVYFFKRKQEKSKNWKLDYVSFQPADTIEYLAKNFTTKKSISYKSSELNKELDEVMEGLALKGRKRIHRSKGRRSSYDYEDLYGD